MGFPITCPRCGHTQDVPEHVMGTDHPCESCNHVFRMEYPYAPPTSLQTRPAPTSNGTQPTPGVVSFEQGISRGFNLYTSNFGPLLLIALVYCAIQFGVGILQQIPILGVLVALVAPFTIQPVVTAGFGLAALKYCDGGEGKVDDLFAEFNQMGNLALLVLTQVGIWLAAIIIPAGIAAAGLVPMFIALDKHPGRDPEVWQIIMGSVGGFLLIVVVLIVAMIFYWSYFAFVDRHRGFWDAINVSWQLTRNNPWGTLGIAIVAGLIGGIGILLCLVGVIFTLPAYYCIVSAAYRTAMPKISVDTEEPFPAEDGGIG